MDKKSHRKCIVYPWNVDGYVELSYGYKRNLIKSLLTKYKTAKFIVKHLNVPEYWFNNFKRNNKIHTEDLYKVASLTNDGGIIKEIFQFNDDKGSSSIPFMGRFPIKYDALWHFLFCLSVGDGSISKGSKRTFVWYQKPEGQKLVVELLKKLNFDYKPSLYVTKKGLTIPQLIRKIGSFITTLDSSYEIKNNMVRVSSKLGKDYELAFLAAFFLDEAGMSKSKLNSEITLHQEGNLKFLEKVGELLTNLNVKWSKNKKGKDWCIRINSEGVIELSKLFDSLKKYNIDLLHRKEIFIKKVEMANKTINRIPLRSESSSIKKYLLKEFGGKEIALGEIKCLFRQSPTVSSRARRLVYTMKKRSELKPISFSKYIIKGVVE